MGNDRKPAMKLHEAQAQYKQQTPANGSVHCPAFGLPMDRNACTVRQMRSPESCRGTKCKEMN